MLSMNRNFSRFCFENKARNADNVAYVPFFKCCVGLVAHVVFADIKLNISLAVAKSHKAGLAHDTAGNYAAAQRNGFSLESVEILLYILRTVGDVIFGLYKGILSRLAKGGKLVSSDLKNLA